jgi:hypothetical protein
MVGMDTLHLSELELARDIHAVLAQVQRGVNVVIEQDNRPVAVIRRTPEAGRWISECIALAEARGASAIPDEGFMKDVEAGIEEHGIPWNPLSWD